MIGALVTFIIYLLILGLLVALVQWLVRTIPLPEPFARLINIAIVVIAVLIVILLLLNLAGMGGGIDMPRIG
jgi:uncharacterized protein YhhL (DUF1145 family)